LIPSLHTPKSPKYLATCTLPKSEAVRRSCVEDEIPSFFVFRSYSYEITELLKNHNNEGIFVGGNGYNFCYILAHSSAFFYNSKISIAAEKSVAYYWEFVDNLKKKHCWL
jgi:hypothetical protein